MRQSVMQVWREIYIYKRKSRKKKRDLDRDKKDNNEKGF